MDFRDAAIGAAQSWVCRNLDTAENINAYFTRVTASRGGIGVPITEIATPIRNFGRYLAQCPASSGPYPAPPAGVPGQCPGVNYTISGTANVRNSSGTVIRQYGYLTTRDGPLPEFILTFNANNVLVIDAAGTTLANLGTTPTGTSSVDWVDGYPDITRTDGSPNEACDNPGVGSPPPLTYDSPDGTSTTENVSITINDPVLPPNGDITIPVTVTGPGWEVRVDLPGEGEPRVGNPETPVGENPCCATEEPDTDPPPSDEPPPVSEGRVIVGCFVVCSTPPNEIDATQVFVESGPTLFFPRIGSVLFGVRKGQALSWLNPEDVQLRRCYIPCPDENGAIAVIPAPQNNASLSITPVYATIATESDEE